MKKSRIKFISFSIGILLIAALTTAMVVDQGNLRESNDLPILMDRSDKIQNGKEWDLVQSQYMKNILSIKENDKNFNSYLQLTQLFIQEARVTGEHGYYYPAALETLDRVIRNSTKDDGTYFQALVLKAGVQLSLHDFQEAKETAEEAELINSLSAQLLGVLVDVNVELGDYENAIKYADKMISIKPDLRAYSRISYLRELHGDLDGAREALLLAIKSGYPGRESTAWAMLTLGEFYLRYGQPEKAKSVFEEILVTRENYAFAVSALGEIMYEEGYQNEGENKIQEAMDIIPEFGFYVQMAEVYKDQNRPKEFETIVREILVMLKEDTNSGHNMNLEYADLYLNLLDDSAKALEFALIEYQKRPQNIDTNLMLAEIYSFDGDKIKAAKHLETAKRTNVRYPKISTLETVLKS